ncbi:MAG: hypothetical protein H6633_35775 [Anaerolineales bacterium]|nr:hypothetical protein [Anaerolineales bacterium]
MADSIAELEHLAAKNRAGGHTTAADAAQAQARELRATCDAWAVETRRAVEPGAAP